MLGDDGRTTIAAESLRPANMGLHDVPHGLVEMVTNAVSAFLLIVLFYILQHILDMHFECSCVAGLHPNGWMFILFPSLILTFILQILGLLKEKRRNYFSTWHCLVCNCCSSHLCGHLLKLLLKLYSMTAMWLSSVLFDGDWYFCLMTNYSPSQTGLPCKANLTAEERQIKNGYRTQSLVSNNTTTRLKLYLFRCETTKL